MRNNFVRLYCDSCHISVHLKKKLHKTGEFCIAVLILKVEEKRNVFGILCFIISRKIKTQLKCTKKDLFSVQRRCCD